FCVACAASCWASRWADQEAGAPPQAAAGARCLNSPGSDNHGSDAMFPSIDDLMKAQAEAFKTSNSVATTAFDGARRLLELNVQAARAGLEESNAQLKALLATKDVRALNDLLTDLFNQYSKPDPDKAA